ncbi:signal peptidase II [Massilia sp. W12]|uniref:signal peptidase II n=1 Tax=Massilia sp. W12 TaxID=3126507 RepID=UPI0030CB5D6A
MAGKKSPAAAPAKTGANNRLLPWLGIAAIIILLDQITKITVFKTMSEGQVIPITSFFNLRFVYNPGAAFSFLANAGGWQRWFFTVLGVVAAIYITWLLARAGGQRLFCWAMSLILGGAIGNVIDRIAYGKVVDFLDFHYQGMSWPAFNLADSAICVGAVLFIVDEFRRVQREKA